MDQKINTYENFKKIREYFSPRIIGEVNDVYVKQAIINGEEIPWHNHHNEDELFLVMEGELLFEEENKAPFIMQEGDMYIVKRRVNHRVSSKAPCKIILIENKTTAHTGEIQTAITKTIEQQKGN